MLSNKFIIAILLISSYVFFLSFKIHHPPVSHNIWDKLLKKYVSKDGAVNYKGFITEKQILEQYLNLLATNHPDESWSENESLAYWINAYNAFTVKLIIDHYPVRSIKDIAPKLSIPYVNSVWDIKFIKIEGETYDLNHIEHNILRKKFDEPRIHFAIVCASYSCPSLRQEAYIPDKIKQQLTEQTKLFLRDKRKNIITINQVKLSKIFDWFKEDFTKKSSLIDFLNTYTDIKINSNNISYLEYDWQLNE